MDARIENGDIYLTSSGDTEYLSGVREAVQRALIAATAVKGTFIYDRSLGADYAAIGEEGISLGRLDMLIREAAADIADTQVRVTGWDADHHTAALSVTYGGKTAATEVDLHGIL